MLLRVFAFVRGECAEALFCDFQNNSRAGVFDYLSGRLRTKLPVLLLNTRHGSLHAVSMLLNLT